MKFKPENYKFILIYALCFLALALVGCKPEDSVKKAAKTTEVVAPVTKPVCSMEGSWKRCSADGPTNSTLVELKIEGGVLQENIQSFSATNDCSGLPDGAFAFSGSIQLGETGKSSFIENGTDVSISADMDIFGCGIGQPGYTLIGLSEDCDTFVTTTTGPSCALENVGTAWDPNAFHRQQ